MMTILLVLLFLLVSPPVEAEGRFFSMGMCSHWIGASRSDVRDDEVRGALWLRYRLAFEGTRNAYPLLLYKADTGRYLLVYDKQIHRDLKPAALAAALIPARRSLEAARKQRLLTLSQLALPPALEPMRKLAADEVRLMSDIEDTELRYHAAQDPSLLTAPIGGLAIAPHCKEYAALLSIVDPDQISRQFATEEPRRCAASFNPDQCRYNLDLSLLDWREGRRERFDIVNRHYRFCVEGDLRQRAHLNDVNLRIIKEVERVLQIRRALCEE